MSYTAPLDYLNSKDSSFTKVHKAAKLGNALKLQTLLAQNVNLLDAQDSLGNTPLHYAVLFEHYEASKQLIELGANTTLVNQSGIPITGLIVNEEISTLFVEHETTLASQFTSDSAGEAFGRVEPPAPLTQLFSAVHENNVEQLVELLSLYPSLLNKQEENDGFSLLHSAVISNHYAIAQQLIEAGIEVNIPSKSGETPLYLCNNKKIKKLLTANDACSFSCMHKAVLDNDTDKMMDLAFINHSLVDAIDIEGSTPLHYAVDTNNNEAIKTLAALGANFNKANNINKTPINCTFIKEIEDELKKFGAINHDPFSSKFHTLCINGDLTGVQKAINNKEEMESLGGIDHEDANGCTALIHAVIHGNREIVDSLLVSGANPMHPDNDGFSAIDWAEACEMADMLNKLQSACEFSPEKKTYFKSNINNLIKKFQNKKDNKQILFVVGETHDNFIAEQFQLILISCLIKHGLSTMFYEHDQENTLLCKIPKAAKSLGFDVVPADIHPNRGGETMSERNKIIANVVNKSNKPGMLVVGSDHLKGLLTHKKETLDTSKYHIIPLNLNHFNPKISAISDYLTFSRDSQKVIQVTEKGLEFKGKILSAGSRDNKIKKNQSIQTLHSFGILADTKPSSQNPAGLLTWGWNAICTKASALFFSEPKPPSQVSPSKTKGTPSL
tara:strand:+ start:2997 stop:5009 length:2013 start_codon:yes stop_codon:yes gene_type:complete